MARSRRMGLFGIGAMLAASLALAGCVTPGGASPGASAGSAAVTPAPASTVAPPDVTATTATGEKVEVGKVQAFVIDACGVKPTIGSVTGAAAKAGWSYFTGGTVATIGHDLIEGLCPKVLSDRGKDTGVGPVTEWASLRKGRKPKATVKGTTPSGVPVEGEVVKKK